MMKRRWSNNGGFTALRMLEESSSEVTSSSNGLVLSSGVNMSPSSLDSHDYEQDLWMCGNDAGVYSNSNGLSANANSVSGTAAQLHNSVITMAMNGGTNAPVGNCTSSLPAQTTIIPINANGMNIGQTVLHQQSYGGGGNVPGSTQLGGGLGNGQHHNAMGNSMNNVHMQNGHGMIGSTTTSTMHMHQNGSVGSSGGGMGGIGPGGMGGGNMSHMHTNGNGLQHTPRSDSANSISSGRDDLSPSSSLNGYSANEGCDAKKSKKGPAPRLQEELCLVCGDRASGYHYNALTCEGCKGFFRRSVTKNAVYCCKFGRACEMDMYMRRKCQECRLKKCLAVGMRPECVVPENQCAMKRREKKAQKEKDKVTTSPSSNPGTPDYIKKEILELMTCEPPQHPTCPLLPEEILEKCQERNIPPLTYNQLAVIYKLIWYQDGYEQPSEEDLKRIMSQPDENESQTDVSFRHITEITILTVQLIVEFAKGLPAFTKIPQEDQITLLKACSSEVMMLRMARRYDHSSDSIFFANNRSYTRDSYKMAGMADNIEDLLHFCRQMYLMKVDNVEYALLTAIVIFSDRPGLEEAQLVEAIQSYYIDTLRIYILNRHCGDPMSLVFYAKLLSILTELRTLGNQNAEMCFSLKLKNRKLPKFLEEIWDVHAIPPSVQSHLQAQQEDRLRAERMRAQTEAAAAASGGGDGVVDSDGASTSAAAAAAAAHQSSGSGGGGICDIVVTGLGSPPTPPMPTNTPAASITASMINHVGPIIGPPIGGSSSNITSSMTNDYIGSSGVGLGPPTAAASSTSIATAVPASSTTTVLTGGTANGGAGVGVPGTNVNNIYNAQTALALMGVPLHHDQLIGGTVVKSEHSTTA